VQRGPTSFGSCRPVRNRRGLIRRGAFRRKKGKKSKLGPKKKGPLPLKEQRSEKEEFKKTLSVLFNTNFIRGEKEHLTNVIKGRSPRKTTQGKDYPSRGSCPSFFRGYLGGVGKTEKFLRGPGGVSLVPIGHWVRCGEKREVSEKLRASTPEKKLSSKGAQKGFYGLGIFLCKKTPGKNFKGGPGGEKRLTKDLLLRFSAQNKGKRGGEKKKVTRKLGKTWSREDRNWG